MNTWSLGSFTQPIPNENMEFHHTFTSPMPNMERKRLLSDPPVCRTKQAVVWIKKAHQGSLQWVDNCSQEQFDYFCFLKRMKLLWWSAKYLLVALMVFDVPASCIGSAIACSTRNRQWYSSSISVIPSNISAGLSIVLYAIIYLRIYVRRKALGSIWQPHNWVKFNLIVTTLGMLGCFCAFFAPWLYLISNVCRPLVFVGGTKKLRQGMAEIVRAIPSFLDVLVSLFLCVLMFTCVAMVLFVRTPEGAVNMQTWGKALYHMWIFFTTSNSPNVFIVAFNTNRTYFLFFFAYLLCTLYLLGNILLAKVYDAYKVVLKEDIDVYNHNVMYGINKAFELLANGHNYINAETWAKFFVEYCDPAIGGVQVEDPYDTHYNSWRAQVVLQVFHGVNTEAGISLRQFEEIMLVFVDRKTYIPKRRPPKNKSSSTTLGMNMNFLFTKGITINGKVHKWDEVMDCIIAVGTLVAVWEAIWFCQSRVRPMSRNPTFWIVFAFSVFYTLSITTKIMSIGMERFWHRKPIQHRFDFFNVYALIISELIYLFVWHSETMERAIVILSISRGLRLCKYMKPLKNLFFVIQRLLPTFWQIFIMLMVVFCVFIAIGKVVFGGKIYNTNPVLAGSGFAHAEFWELNFNDFVGGWVTLFAIMVVNNWFVIGQGYNLIEHTLFTSLFFVVFFVVVNLIVLNILMALILDCTSIVTEELAAEDAKEMLHHGDDDMHQDDLEQMASGSGAHSAEYMLRKVLCTDEHFDDHFHEQHPELPSNHETPRTDRSVAENNRNRSMTDLPIPTMSRALSGGNLGLSSEPLRRGPARAGSLSPRYGTFVDTPPMLDLSSLPEPGTRSDQLNRLDSTRSA